MGSDHTPFNPKRRLCSDGACIGTIGSDGQCTVCQSSGTVEEPAFFPEDMVMDATPTPTTTPILDPAPSAIPPAINRRRLCPDGNCIGVLDATGMCGTCGQRASSPEAVVAQNNE